MASVIGHGSIVRIRCGEESYEIGSLVDGKEIFCIDDESDVSDDDSDRMHRSARQPYSEVIVEGDDGAIVRLENYGDVTLKSQDGHIVAANIGPDTAYHLGDRVDGRKVTRIRYYNSDWKDVAHVEPCYLLYGRDYCVVKVLRGKPIATYYRPVEYF